MDDEDKSSIGSMFTCYWMHRWYPATRECFCLLGSINKELGVVFETSSTGIFEEKESKGREDRVDCWK